MGEVERRNISDSESSSSTDVLDKDDVADSEGEPVNLKMDYSGGSCWKCDM